VFADPNIVEGAVPMVEHTVLPMLPAGEVGAGLTPGDAISVAPSGMPVPPTGAPGTMPSGEVTESDGVGITAACCAEAWLYSRAEAAVIIRKRFMCSPIAACGSTSSAAVQRQGPLGMQVVVVAIGIIVVEAVARTVSAVAVQCVLVESRAVCADASADVASIETAYAAAETAHVFAGADTADMSPVAKTSDAAAAAHRTDVAAATEAATEATAMTAAPTATTGFGCAREQARSEKSCCQYREHPFHRELLFSQICQTL
jgi:hypothetical protein